MTRASAGRCRSPFVHGFSASAPELSPLPERIADNLDAHLYYARLTGHGLPGAQMAGASVAHWLQDARETLAIASRLGERVVLLGSSTGATLGAWLAVEEARAGRDRLAAIVLLSPNFGLADRRSGALLLPGATHIARALVGAQRSFDPLNALHAEHWTTTYPLARAGTDGTHGAPRAAPAPAARARAGAGVLRRGRQGGQRRRDPRRHGAVRWSAVRTARAGGARRPEPAHAGR